MFAHWPGKSSRWYDDLRRIAAYGSVLGTFSHDHRLLRADRRRPASRPTTSPTSTARPICSRTWPPAGAIRSPAGSGTSAAGRSSNAWQALQTLASRVQQGGKGEGGRGKTRNDETSERGTRRRHRRVSATPTTTIRATLDDELADQLQQAACRFRTVRSPAARASAERGCLVVNPWSFPQQACPSSFILHPSSFASLTCRRWASPGSIPARRNRRRAVERKGWFGRRKPQEPPPLAEENVLRNEFFEIHFDPHTGAIRSISDYHSRDPRLAQQIALRLPHGGEPGADVELLDHGGRRTRGDLGRAGAGRNRLPRPAAGPRGPPRGRIPADDPRVARQPRDRAADRVGHRPPARREPVGFVLRRPLRLERRDRQRLPQREPGQPADGA